MRSTYCVYFNVTMPYSNSSNPPNNGTGNTTIGDKEKNKVKQKPIP